MGILGRGTGYRRDLNNCQCVVRQLFGGLVVPQPYLRRAHCVLSFCRKGAPVGFGMDNLVTLKEKCITI